jgi:hypothetical protein
MSIDMKKFQAIHLLHITREGALKRIDPGTEVELTEEEATMAGASVVPADASREDLSTDRLPSFAEFRAQEIAEFEQRIHAQYNRLAAEWNRRKGVVFAKAPDADMTSSPQATAPDRKPAKSTTEAKAEVKPGDGK